MNIFETATKAKYRFNSNIGQLSTEDLWDLPLTTTRETRASLDIVAKTLYEEIQTSDEVSFVEDTTIASSDLQNKMEIIKHIIQCKKDEHAEAQNRVARKQKRDLVDRIILEAEEGELKKMSVEDLKSLRASL